MKINLIITVFTVFLISACSEKTQEAQENKSMDFSDITKNLAGSKEAKEARYGFLKHNVIIILAEELNKDSSNLKVQDYMDDKGSFIPVFTSIEKYNESSQGNTLGKARLEINAYLMLSMMNENDRILKNPSLSDEEYFTVSELKNKFATEIDSVKKKLGNQIK